MKEYQGFAISNFRTGLDEAVEPWLLPREAFQSMINAHLYRGVLEKIDGYNVYAKMSNRSIVTLGVPDGATKTFSITIAHTPTTSNFYAFGTIVAGTSAEIFSYSSDGVYPVINLQGSAGGTGTVNLTTRAVSITFNAAPPAGSTVLFAYDYAPASASAIMGIKPYFSNTGASSIMVFDQKRVGVIVPSMGILAQNMGCLQAVSEIPHAYYSSAAITGNSVTVTFSGTLTNPIVPGTVTFFQFKSGSQVSGGNITDNGYGELMFGGSGIGTVNYRTGAWTATFGVAPATGVIFDSVVGVYGDLFTGGISNFFSLTNYQYYAFFTNGKDPIFYYDGTTVQYLNTNLEAKSVTSSGGVPTNLDITTCLHVFTNQSRLLLIAPTLAVGGQLVSTIYWSTIFQPLNFSNDEFLGASTSQPIRAIGYINSDLIVRFANSEAVFRYTGDAFSPFRFDPTNSVWACDAPYSSINYDKYFTSVGKPAIVRSNGVNIDRADELIPDFTDPTSQPQDIPLPNISQTSIGQCYGERFDDLKEGWLCYNSGAAESSVTASNNILAFNYLDDTYAIYTFPFSCLGFGKIINPPTWGTIWTPWEEMASTWGSYALQNAALLDLGGDQYDTVYQIGEGSTMTAPGDATTTPIPVTMSVVSKNFNPFIEDGQLARFGYLDLFVSAYAETTLRVRFFVNDQLWVDENGAVQGYYQENILTFTPTDAMSPTVNQVKVWKRIYVGAIGKEHTIQFCQLAADLAEEQDQPVWIHAMVLWMKPAGRIFS